MRILISLNKTIVPVCCTEFFCRHGRSSTRKPTEELRLLNVGKPSFSLSLMSYLGQQQQAVLLTTSHLYTVIKIFVSGICVCVLEEFFFSSLSQSQTGLVPRSELCSDGPDFHFARAPPILILLSALSQVHPAGSSYTIRRK